MLEIKAWHYYLSLLVYLLVSVYVFPHTVVGWASLVVIPIGLILYKNLVILTLLLFLIQIKKKTVHVSKRILYFVLGLQAAAFMTNYSDCGDGAGSFNYFQILFVEGGISSESWSEFCKIEPEALFSFYVFATLAVVYILSLLYFMFRTFKSAV